MFICNIAEWGFDHRFASILAYVFWQAVELFLMFLEVFPGDSLEIRRFEDAFVGEFLHAPNQAIEIDSQVID